MERDHCEPPLGAEHVEGGRQSILELTELVVDRDAERLEDALRRMAVSEARRRRDGGADQLDQLTGSLDRLLLAATRDRTGDLLRVTLFPVAAEDRDQVALGPAR